MLDASFNVMGKYQFVKNVTKNGPVWQYRYCFKGTHSYFSKLWFSVSFEESSLQRCKSKISVETVKPFGCMKEFSILQLPISYTVVWNDYLLIFWLNVIFYFTRSWKPNANNQICWITKVSTHSKTLIQFCWKFIYFKDVYWWFLKIWICDKMRALFIFQIIDYAWISIMLFDLCWNW